MKVTQKKFKNDLFSVLVLAQHEVGENDEVSLKAIQDMQSSIVKMSNNATSMIAGFENELNQLEVEC